MATEKSASVFADADTVLLVKEKVWSPGPIYIADAPWQRFTLDDLSGVQGFLINILTTPTKEESGELPVKISTKEFLSRLKVRSLREAVDQYKFVRVQVVDDTLVANSYKRDLQNKSWSEMQANVRETMWRTETLGAVAVLAGLRISE
jgi:hypothetical protein